MSWADGAQPSQIPTLQKMSTAQAQELFNVSGWVKNRTRSEWWMAHGEAELTTIFSSAFASSIPWIRVLVLGEDLTIPLSDCSLFFHAGAAPGYQKAEFDFGE